jgi:hypothetical protein
MFYCPRSPLLWWVWTVRTDTRSVCASKLAMKWGKRHLEFEFSVWLYFLHDIFLQRCFNSIVEFQNRDRQYQVNWTPWPCILFPCVVSENMTIKNGPFYFGENFSRNPKTCLDIQRKNICPPPLYVWIGYRSVKGYVEVTG